VLFRAPFRKEFSMAVVTQPARSVGNRYPQKPAAPVDSKNGNSAQPAAKFAAARSGSRSDGPSNPDRAVNQRYRGAPKPDNQNGRAANSARPAKAGTSGAAAKPEPEILFQKYFKSVGPRTYAAQLKRAGNGNHFLVLTESKRDEKTNEPRKTRLYIYSEDFVAYFRMLHETAQFIRQNPVPEKTRKRQELHWSRKSSDERPSPAPR
jgi:hypothetical protein